MRRAIVAIVGAASAAVLAVSGTAATTPMPDLSSADPVHEYLVSIGVDPASVVRQMGLKNYAGPLSGCPGPGWNCTAETRVVQITQEGGENRANCDEGVLTVAPTSQTCVIVQAGPSGHNVARCSERLDLVPGATQSCTITQTGTNNDAQVLQVIDQNHGPAQNAVQTARVMQSATKDNDLHVEQTIRQETKTGAVQTQEAHQALTVVQTTSGGGGNESHVHQRQDQKAFGGSTQLQNTGASPIGDCNQPDQVFTLANPNECADIIQTSAAGRNANTLRQTLDQSAKTDVVATQVQGSSDGGLDGDVKQTTTAGSSTNNADQRKKQVAMGDPGSAQTQLDPTRCCGVSQIGGLGNVEDLDQRSAQTASEQTAALQQIMLIGMSNSLTGACTIRQTAKTDADAAFESFSFEPCTPVVVVTECRALSTPNKPGDCVTVARPIGHAAALYR